MAFHYNHYDKDYFLPNINDILNKQIILNDVKSLVFDFSQCKKAFFPFRIVNTISIGSDTKPLVFTKSVMIKVILYLQSCDFSLSGNDNIYNFHDVKIYEGVKSYIMSRCLKINSKLYLDIRLWSKINNMPSKRGFRFEIKDLRQVLDKLTEALNFYDYWHIRISEYIEKAIDVLTSYIDEKINIIHHDLFNNCLLYRVLENKPIHGVYNKTDHIRRNMIKTIKPLEFEIRMKNCFNSSVQINSFSVLNYIQTNDIVSMN